MQQPMQQWTDGARHAARALTVLDRLPGDGSVPSVPYSVDRP